MSAPDAEFQDQADPGVEAPQTQDTVQDDYKSRTGQSPIPVISDNAAVEDNIGSRKSADSGAQLGTFLCYLKPETMKLTSYSTR
jgi:hypothetical protein